jgi:aminodeoxychorismate lyase
MIVCLNGQFIPEPEAKISVFDRCFLYGDGLFESIPFYCGKPFRWARHLERLESGANFLDIHLPFSSSEIAAQCAELLGRNGMANALVRIHLSRGVGMRGYSTQGANQPLVILTTHPLSEFLSDAPTGWRLVTSTFRVLSQEPLARYKTASKLLHVLARAEADLKGADEALLLNQSGEIAEATSANLFWLEHGRLCTPPLSSGALPGVTRAVVLELAPRLGFEPSEQPCTPDQLVRAAGVFLTLSSRGIVEAMSLDGAPLARCEAAGRLHQVYQGLVCSEISETG